MDDQDEVQGHFLRIPYNWRKPTAERYKNRLWNPDDERVLIPKTFGWGYEVNLYEVGRRLGVLD